MARSDIWLADLIEAIDDLKIGDPARAREIARMLQLDGLVQQPTLPAVAAAPPPSDIPPPVATEVPSPKPRDESPPRVAPLGSAPRSASLQRLAGASSSGAATPDDSSPESTPRAALPPTWYASVAALPKPRAPATPSTEHRPLFPAQRARGLIGAAFATWGEDGELDLDRLVETLAELRPLMKLPQRLTPTLRRGVQLLIDVGFGMAPFRTDVERITAAIGAVLGDFRIDCRYFTGCPLRGCVVQGEATPSAWHAPSRGTPVAAITDLGIGGPVMSDDRASVDEWLKFALAVRAAGRRLTVLVPYGAPRWPVRLTRLMHLIHWDPRTTPAAIRRSVTGRERRER